MLPSVRGYSQELYRPNRSYPIFELDNCNSWIIFHNFFLFSERPLEHTCSIAPGGYDVCVGGVGKYDDDGYESVGGGNGDVILNAGKAGAEVGNKGRSRK